METMPPDVEKKEKKDAQLMQYNAKRCAVAFFRKDRKN
jgi:hypothetical protein